MTKSEQKILSQLGWGNPPVRSYDLRKATGLTASGLSLVVRRMEERNLVAVVRDNGWSVELTFAGHKAKERAAL